MTAALAAAPGPGPVGAPASDAQYVVRRPGIERPRTERVQAPGLRYVESRLYAYDIDRRDLHEREQDILYRGIAVSFDSQRASSPGGHGDPTGNRALELADDEWAAETHRVHAAIRRVLGQLDADHQHLVALWYWRPPQHRLTPEQIAHRLHYGRRTVDYWRLAIVRAIAYELGIARRPEARPPGARPSVLRARALSGT